MVVNVVLAKMMDDNGGSSMRTKKILNESLPNNTAFKRNYSDEYCMFLHVRKHCQKLPLLYIITDTDVNQKGIYLISNMFRAVVFKMFLLCKLH
jgi:hypothetical protein